MVVMVTAVMAEDVKVSVGFRGRGIRGQWSVKLQLKKEAPGGLLCLIIVAI